MAGEFDRVGLAFKRGIVRLTSTGAIDVGYFASVNGSVLAMQERADGKVLIGGNFIAGARTHFTQLLRSGTADGSFNSSANIPNGLINTIALTADGKVTLGGAFTEIGGLTRARLARLSSNGVASQAIEYIDEDDQVFWERTGTGPEFGRTTIEVSSDQATWSAPIAGEFTADKWLFSGVEIEPNIPTYLRFRGWSGVDAGSLGSLTEVTQQVFVAKDEDDACFVVKSSTNKVAVFCL